MEPIFGVLGDPPVEIVDKSGIGKPCYREVRH
jgi:hypothetical protein